MIMDQLTKSSTSEEIKEYFNAILALKEKNELYPVNIDDVWPLVYSERGKATRALKANFIENEDYILLPKMAKTSMDVLKMIISFLCLVSNTLLLGRFGLYLRYIDKFFIK